MIFDILKMTLHESSDMLQNQNQRNHEINVTIKALSIAQRKPDIGSWYASLYRQTKCNLKMKDRKHIIAYME